VLASGRLPTLVSATPTMAYLPLMFDIKSSGQNGWSRGVQAYRGGPQTEYLTFLYPITPIISNPHLANFPHQNHNLGS
jgi:hypothetical protein